MTRDVVLEVIGEAASSAALGRPEIVSVLVVDSVPVAESIARLVAPLVARRLYPARAFGAVLHLEPAETAGAWYADVEVVYSLGQVSR